MSEQVLQRLIFGIGIPLWVIAGAILAVVAMIYLTRPR